mgnify:CR=1 FL=1
MRRIGVFGGAFDPVHFGHLHAAEECRDSVPLDEVWFVPSAHHPWKAPEQAAPFADRAAMLRLALAGRLGLRLDEIERELPAPTYTANTLDALASRHPECEWFFLLGADALAEFHKWYEPHRIAARATLVAMARPGHAVLSADQLRNLLDLPDSLPLRLQIVHSSGSPVASRDIRRRVAEGESIAGLTPPAVVDYIARHGLYRRPATKNPAERT